MYNWCTLNQKVFKRLGFLVAKNECQACAKCQPGAIERVLKLVRLRLARFAEGPGVLFSGSVVKHSLILTIWRNSLHNAPFQPTVDEALMH